MSGYASYDEDEFEKCSSFFRVPRVKASEESLKGFATIVHNYEDEKVIIETWPYNGSRGIMNGTGRGGGIVEGIFSFRWENDFLKARNEAVDGSYTVGKKLGNGDIVTRELNYHPDGGQVVFSNEIPVVPFVLLLGKKGDDLKLGDVTAFECDGTFGVQILPGVWHQPVFPTEDALFLNKQGAVHACVGFDSVNEYGRWLCF